MTASDGEAEEAEQAAGVRREESRRRARGGSAPGSSASASAAPEEEEAEYAGNRSVRDWCGTGQSCIECMSASCIWLPLVSHLRLI